MVGKDNTEKAVTTFINMLKITEVKDFEYTIHFHNTFSNKVFIFRIYKELFDKAMEIRDIDELNIKTGKDIVEGKKKAKQDENGVRLYA